MHLQQRNSHTKGNLYGPSTDRVSQAVVKRSMMDQFWSKASCDKLPQTQALKCFSCVIYETEHAKLALGRADSASMFEQCPEEMELVSNSLYPIQPSAAAQQAGKVTTGVPCRPLLRVLG